MNTFWSPRDIFMADFGYAPVIPLMNLRILLVLVFVNGFSLLASSTTTPLISDKTKNSTENDFLNVIIPTLFSIPCVEEAFYVNYDSYKNSHHIAASIAHSFAQIRETGRATDLRKWFDPNFLLIISKEKVSVENLFELLCEHFPPIIKSLFYLKMDTFLMKGQLKTAVGLKLYAPPDGRGIFDNLNVWTPETDPRSITQFPRKIVESSKVLVFRLERSTIIGNNPFFDAKLVFIEPKIIVNDHYYNLKTVVKQADSMAQSLYFKGYSPFLDSDSVLLFYVLKEIKECVEICVPEALKTLYMTRRSEQTAPVEPAQSNPEVESRTSPQKVRAFIERNRHRMTTDEIDLMSKFLESKQVLGQDEYAFLAGPNGISYSAVELVLSVMASNKNFVFKLFEEIKRETSDSFNLEMAVVFLKMLLGCKTISLDRIVIALAQKSGLAVEAFEYSKNLLFLSKQMDLIISLIDATFIHAPITKTVEYSNLESDDPIEMRVAISHEGINPQFSIPPRLAQIKGIWCDTRDEQNTRRIRRIYSSPISELISIKIERFFKDSKTNTPIFGNINVELHSSHYRHCGSISLEVSEYSKRIVALCYNDFTGTYTSFTAGSRSKNINPSSEYLNKMTKQLSLQLFYKKVDNGMDVTAYTIGQVPKRISSNTFAQILGDCGFKKQHQKSLEEVK